MTHLDTLLFGFISTCVLLKKIIPRMTYLEKNSASTALLIIFINRALQSYKVETWIISFRTA